MTPLRQSALLLSLGVAFFLCAVPETSAANLRINAPRIELDLAPGETYSGEFGAENPADEELKVRLYLEDWAYMPGGKGEKQFLPAGTTALTAAPWITFTPAAEVLKPFGRITVNYTVRVPEDATGGRYAVLFLETELGIVQDADGANVLVSGRIGALFFIRVKGTVDKRGRIVDARIAVPEGNRPLELRTTFENSGNVDITLGGNFLILDGEGNVAARGPLESIYTFPGSTESGVTQWVGRLRPGSYDAVLTYDLGQGQNLVEERSFEVS